MLKYLFTIITFFFSTLIFGQKLTARILDVSQNPIAFATIQTAENKGVISNEEGFFTINLENNNINTIEINSLGFTTKTISIEEIKRNNYIVVLDEFIDVLSQVYVSNSIPDVNDIIYKANKNLSTNYSNENIKYNLLALDIYKSIDNKLGIANIYNNIAEAYSREKDYNKALEYHLVGINYPL